MKKDIVYKLTENFEDFLHATEDGVEFWLARDLQHLLGYGKWDNFQNVIAKQKLLANYLVKLFQTILPTSGKWLKSVLERRKKLMM